MTGARRGRTGVLPYGEAPPVERRHAPKALLRRLCAPLLRRGFPTVEGEVRGLPLACPVHVRRDRWGIASISADNLPDLLFAQGFVHAQDRLFQMETLRRMAAGRLSEIAGEKACRMDHFVRLLDLPALRRRILTGAGEREHQILTAYARGVNAFLERNHGKLPLEFRMLRLESFRQVHHAL